MTNKFKTYSFIHFRKTVHPGKFTFFCIPHLSTITIFPLFLKMTRYTFNYTVKKIAMDFYSNLLPARKYCKIYSKQL